MDEVKNKLVADTAVLGVRLAALDAALDQRTVKIEAALDALAKRLALLEEPPPPWWAKQQQKPKAQVQPKPDAKDSVQ